MPSESSCWQHREAEDKRLSYSRHRFAVLVMPHYADQVEASKSPFVLPNDGAMTWQWLNTVNRVNTQVKKVGLYICQISTFPQSELTPIILQTLILCYVTIHSNDKVTAKDLENPISLLGRYSVREVTIRRFVPARMRD